jgi:hypothetical protein
MRPCERIRSNNVEPRPINRFLCGVRSQFVRRGDAVWRYDRGLCGGGDTGFSAHEPTSDR